MLRALVGRSLGRARGLLLGVVALLCGFQFLIVVIAGEVQRNQTFSALAALLPAFFQSLVGGLVFTSFAGLVSFGFVHPIVVLALVEAAIFLASEPAWEVESGIVDVTMARPVTRGLLITRTILVTLGATAAILLLMLGAMSLALYAFAPEGVPWPRFRTTVLLAVNLMSVSWWFGGLSLLVSAFVRRRSAAIGAAGLAAFALYLFNLAAEISPSWQRLRPLTPFHYYDAPALIRGAYGQWPADVTVLLGTSALLILAAWRAYLSRDL